MATDPRFIVCVFDGLRRDMITTEAMPRLWRFLNEGVDFPLSRAVFPTATRVNAAALGHGAPPAQTGLVANSYFDPRVFSDRLFDTGNFDHLQRAEAAYGGRFIPAVSLGEAARRGGFSTAVIGTGSPGTTRWVNPRAEDLGQVGLSLRHWVSSTPAGFASEVLDRFGPIPPAEIPDLHRLRLQTDMLLDAVMPEIAPDIAILWFDEPDASLHPCGVGSPESWRAAAGADEQFGRILDWCRASDEPDRFQIFVVSDHGHLTASRKIDFGEEMATAGFGFDDHFRDGVVYAGGTSYQGTIRVRDGDPGRTRDLVSWLSEQTWCGMIFTAGGDGVEGGVPGTLNRGLLLVDHERAPDIYFMMRTHDDENEHGFRGGTYYDARYKVGGAVHGGLHPREASCLLAAQGSLFEQARRSSLPAGIIDVAPTILHLLGCEIPATMTGRVLAEALADDDAEPGEMETGEFAVGASPRRHVLRHWRVGGTRYIEGGWLE